MTTVLTERPPSGGLSSSKTNRQMAKRDPFVDHVLELLEPLGTMRARSMFGGFGIFHVDRMIALVADDRLYLKTDSDTRPDLRGRRLQRLSSMPASAASRR